MRSCIAFLMLFTAGGCAKYEFDIVQPAELSGHIGEKADQAVLLSRPPLEYRLQAAEGRLVMKITNTLDEPLDLLGEKSYVVDPSGGSHPLRGQTLAPHSYIKLILPPMRPVYQIGPTWSFGVGVGTSYYRRPWWYDPYVGGFYDPFWDQPRYLTVYDESDNTYWRWDDEGTARLHLAFRTKDRSIQQDFVFRRVKLH